MIVVAWRPQSFESLLQRFYSPKIKGKDKMISLIWWRRNSFKILPTSLPRPPELNLGIMTVFLESDLTRLQRVGRRNQDVDPEWSLPLDRHTILNHFQRDLDFRGRDDLNSRPESGLDLVPLLLPLPFSLFNLLRCEHLAYWCRLWRTCRW